MTRGFRSSYQAIVSLSVVVSLVTVTVASANRPSARLFRSEPAHGSVSGALSSQTEFKHLPLRFELNTGQADSSVRFIAATQSGEMFLTPDGLVMRVFQPSVHSGNRPGVKSWRGVRAPQPPESSVLRLRTVNANPNVRITGIDPLPGKTNYFFGNDPKKWHVNVPSFARVKYENVYPGIDLIYYGNEQGNLEYDFDVAPGANPGQIALSIEGGDGASLDDGGNLVLRSAMSSVVQHAPRIYQKDRGGRREIAGGYMLRRDGLVAFNLEGYDAGKALVIDPEVVYATYFGGSMGTDINGLTVDSSGSVYVVGDTFAHDFPTQDPVQGENRHSENYSAIITKFSPDGGSLIYSSYLGGSTVRANDIGLGIALDSTGAAYITGLTASTDFPTKSALQTNLAGVDNLFVAKLSADGATLIYSTYLGGNGIDTPNGVQLDSSNNAYVYGSTNSTNFPTLNPTQASFGGGTSDGFWSVISPNGAQLLFSTYVGGNDQDDVSTLSISSQSGDVYVSGQTQSTNLAGGDGSPRPYHARFSRSSAATADQSARKVGPSDDFPIILFLLAFLDFWDELLNFGTFDIEEFFFLQVFLSEAERPGARTTGQQPAEIEAMVSGSCVETPPATSCSGKASFVMADANKLNIISATNVSVNIPPANSVTRDAQDAIYVAGAAPTNPLFPLVNPVQSAGGGGEDAFVTVFAPVTREVIFSSYIGGSGDDAATGIALDPQGNIYIAGSTTSGDFPTKDAYQSTPHAPNGIMVGQGNSFIVKISSLGQIQTGPDFSLTLAQSTVTATRGTKVPITVDISRLGGLTGKISVKPPAGLPVGIKLPAAAESTKGGALTFTIKLKASAQPGTYTLTFTGSDKAGQSHDATLTLIVQ
jgi:hypothetical protein